MSTMALVPSNYLRTKYNFYLSSICFILPLLFSFPTWQIGILRRQSPEWGRVGVINRWWRKKSSTHELLLGSTSSFFLGKSLPDLDRKCSARMVHLRARWHTHTHTHPKGSDMQYLFAILEYLGCLNLFVRLTNTALKYRIIWSVCKQSAFELKHYTGHCV